MAVYVTKQVMIEAVEWTGDNLDEIKEFAGDSVLVTEDNGEIDIQIHTLEGVMHASVGDYIICGLRDEFYPCKPDVFYKKYELVHN